MFNQQKLQKITLGQDKFLPYKRNNLKKPKRRAFNPPE
jgi:hypothetical protein